MLWGYVITAVVLYLVGAVPTGYIAGRLLKGIDVRDFGSGATGATNVLRTLGRVPFFAVLVLDTLKGWIPVLLIWYVSQSYFDLSENQSHNLQVVGGICAVIGHDFPIYLGFRGGRGVATAFGVYAALAVPVAFGLLPIAIFIILAFRYMSLMSIVTVPLAALVLLGLAVFGLEPYSKAIYGGLASALVLVRHFDNIRRLIKGTEPKLGEGSRRVASKAG
ncbi:MAG: glycerol-3-phosphate 1-O-acyltransferase PlsY [Dehalococcoidia bacterium]